MQPLHAAFLLASSAVHTPAASVAAPLQSQGAAQGLSGSLVPVSDPQIPAAANATGVPS